MIQPTHAKYRHFLSQGTSAQYSSKGNQCQFKLYNPNVKKGPYQHRNLLTANGSDIPPAHLNFSKSPSQLLLAGKVSGCLGSCKCITLDPWTLQVVQGYQIEWSSPPCQQFPVITSMMSKEESQLVGEEVQNLLQEEAVVRASCARTNL